MLRHLPLNLGPWRYRVQSMRDYRESLALHGAKHQCQASTHETRALLQQIAVDSPHFLNALLENYGQTTRVKLSSAERLRQCYALAGVGFSAGYNVEPHARFVFVREIESPLPLAVEVNSSDVVRDEILRRAFDSASDWIEILVLDEENNELESVRCDVVLPSAEHRVVRTDFRGKHRIDPIPTGECEYWLREPWKTRSSPTLASTMTTFNDWIDVVVLDEDGMPWSGSVGKIHGSDTRVHSWSADGIGLHQLASLPSGTCEYVMDSIHAWPNRS